MASLAKRILDEANEDITKSELYVSALEAIQIIISCLEVLAKEFEYAHSDTEVQDIENFGKLYTATNDLCEELDKNGFTYIPQPSEISRKQYGKVFKNFIEFYREYENGFAKEDLEILNTNSKDLLSILDKLR